MQIIVDFVEEIQHGDYHGGRGEGIVHGQYNGRNVNANYTGGGMYKSWW